MYYASGSPDEAELHRSTALQIAQNLVRDDPENLEWRRILAFAHVLQGRAAMSHGDWQGAMADLTKATSIYEDLVSSDETNARMQYDRAFALGMEGMCLRRLRRLEESGARYTAAYDIYRSLAEAEPGILDYVIELARAEYKLGVWHFSHRDTEHDEEGSRWFDLASDRLAGMRDAGRGRHRDWDIQTILSAIDKNRKVVGKRVYGIKHASPASLDR
jgi:tetratricopeptide (TPR) repeat protein